MAHVDGTAFERVGIPGHGTAHPPVGLSLAEEQPFVAICPPAPTYRTDTADRSNSAEMTSRISEPAQADKKSKSNSTGPSHSNKIPKPVEIMSVPETPINGTTPAGGTPRPELNIAEEPAPLAVESDTNTALKSAALISSQELQAAPALLAPSFGREEAENSVKNPPDGSKSDVEQSPESHDGPESATAVSVEPSLEKVVPDSAKKPEPPVTHTGPEAESLPASAPAPTEASVALAIAESVPDGDVKTGTKRKLSDVASLAVAKQPKLDPVSAKPGSANGLGTPAIFEPSLKSPQAAQPKSPPKKVPNGKRGKKAPVVGRTARKTRSQGPADL